MSHTYMCRPLVRLDTVAVGKVEAVTCKVLKLRRFNEKRGLEVILVLLLLPPVIGLNKDTCGPRQFL